MKHAGSREDGTCCCTALHVAGACPGDRVAVAKPTNSLQVTLALALLDMALCFALVAALTAVLKVGKDG